VNSNKIIKSSHYGHRPWWFSLLNRAWEWTYPLGTKQQLTKDSLIGAARKLTGEHDLGADFRDEPLDRLLYSIREEAGLHPIGYFITRQRMINLLAARLLCHSPRRTQCAGRRYPAARYDFPEHYARSHHERPVLCSMAGKNRPVPGLSLPGETIETSTVAKARQAVDPQITPSSGIH